MSGQEKILNRRYRLDHQQGSGGMAVIYKATDLALGRVVAVKILRPSLTSDHSFLMRFRQEARNVANLAHPNIVTVHDVGQDGNTHYIVMEYIDGQNLKDIIRETSPLSVDRVLDLTIQMCAGIGYAHRAGLVHADVKPQNILVTSEEMVKVTDFGIAQALAMTKPEERQKVVWGSPHYFSPEQAQGEYPTPASDVYSIGVVMFEMLTSRLPFTGADQQELALAHIRQMPPRITELSPRVPTDLERIVQKALSKEASARYRSADQLGRILIAYKEKGQEPTDERYEVAKAHSGNSSTSRAIESPMPQSPSDRDIASALATAEHPAINKPAGQQAQPASGYPGYVDPEARTMDAPLTYQPQYPSSDSNYYNPVPPEVMTSPGYRAFEPESLDWVTIVLAFVALIAVVGVVILWIFVWQAYFG